MSFSVFTGGNQHVINAVFGLEQERIAEVILVDVYKRQMPTRSTNPMAKKQSITGISLEREEFLLFSIILSFI